MIYQLEARWRYIQLSTSMVAHVSFILNINVSLCKHDYLNETGNWNYIGKIKATDYVLQIQVWSTLTWIEVKKAKNLWTFFINLVRSNFLLFVHIWNQFYCLHHLALLSFVFVVFKSQQLAFTLENPTLI